MARYECKLPPDLLEKAVNELNEPRDNAERLKAIDELRESYNAEKFGPLKSEEDGFILRFLRAKKFNQKKALIQMQNYHNIKHDFKEVFEKVENPVLLKSISDQGVIYMLDGHSKDGSAVMMYRPGKLDTDTNIYDLMAYSVICMEKVLQEERYQICGVATIEDMDNFNLAMILKTSPRAMAKMNNIWQEAMPLRFKAVHLLNEGRVYDIIMAIFKPFMKSKLLKRIHLHGNKYSELQDFIDCDLLPPYLGGSGLDPEKAADVWNRIL
uniref:CRAL-TRIO domain-containing protein n=1 Tax=Ciona savignyi TaxID=51511 RepID=H2ZHQ0_CIOSA